MSFFYCESGDRLRISRANTILAQGEKRLLPLRARSHLPKRHALKKQEHGRRLLFRSRRHRRLQLLRQFKVGKVYTFTAFHEWEYVPDSLMLAHQLPESGLWITTEFNA